MWGCYTARVEVLQVEFKPRTQRENSCSSCLCRRWRIIITRPLRRPKCPRLGGGLAVPQQLLDAPFEFRVGHGLQRLVEAGLALDVRVGRGAGGVAASG